MPTDDTDIPVMRFDRSKDMAADLDKLFEDGVSVGDDVGTNALHDDGAGQSADIPPATAPEIDANDVGGQSTPDIPSGPETGSQGDSQDAISQPTAPTPNILDIDGLKIPAEQAKDVRELIGWANSMSPQQSAELMDFYNAMMSGKDTSQFKAHQDTAPTTAPTAPATPEPFIPAAISDEYPELAPVFDRIEQRFAEYEQRFSQVEEFDQTIQQREEQTEQQRAIAVEMETVAGFQQEMGLTDEETYALHNAAAESGLAGAFIQQFGLEGGFRKTLEFALQNDPQINQRVFAAKLQELATAQQVNARKTEASQLSGDGGNVNREAYVRGETLSPRANKPRLSEKTAAMAADLDRMQSGM